MSAAASAETTILTSQEESLSRFARRLESATQDAYGVPISAKAVYRSPNTSPLAHAPPSGPAQPATPEKLTAGWTVQATFPRPRSYLDQQTNAAILNAKRFVDSVLSTGDADEATIDSALRNITDTNEQPSEKHH